MIIIIDAYNILKYLYHDHYITEKQRTDFVQLLVRYGKKRRHELIVVFDGGPHGLPDRFVKKPVTVLYTGAQERADDAIIRLINKYQMFDTLIVSRDREITNKAEKENVAYIDSSLFLKFVRAALDIGFQKKQKSQPAYKLHEEANLVVDELMESVEVPSHLAKGDESMVPYLPQAKTLTKNERRLMKIVDKL